MRENSKDMQDLLAAQFGTIDWQWIENTQPLQAIIPADQLLEVAAFLHTHEKCYFDQLSCLSGVDMGREANVMAVVYHLYSIPHDVSLALKVILDREKPHLPSVGDIWRAAWWHERETYDLFGIVFEGHPDLRRILLPEDWQGFPLRKDYEAAATYHGMSISYDRDK